MGVLCGVGACVTTYALKNYIIVKPDWGIQEAVSNSAPSGHTTFAAAAGAGLSPGGSPADASDRGPVGGGRDLLDGCLHDY